MRAGEASPPSSALDLRLQLELSRGRTPRSRLGDHDAWAGSERAPGLCPEGLGRNREDQGRQRAVSQIPPASGSGTSWVGGTVAAVSAVPQGKDPVCACKLLLRGASRHYSNCFHGFCSCS